MELDKRRTNRCYFVGEGIPASGSRNPGGGDGMNVLRDGGDGDNL